MLFCETTQNNLPSRDAKKKKILILIYAFVELGVDILDYIFTYGWKIYSKCNE